MLRRVGGLKKRDIDVILLLINKNVGDMFCILQHFLYSIFFYKAYFIAFTSLNVSMISCSGAFVAKLTMIFTTIARIKAGNNS